MYFHIIASLHNIYKYDGYKDSAKTMKIAILLKFHILQAFSNGSFFFFLVDNVLPFLFFSLFLSIRR